MVGGTGYDFKHESNVFGESILITSRMGERREFRKISKREWLTLCMAGIFLALHFALWFESLKLTTVASSTIILSLQPIVAMVGGFLIYKERTSFSTLMAIGISIIGVVVVGWGDFGSHNQSAIMGDILSFLSVIAVVSYLLIGQNNVKKISHWIYSFCVFLFAGIALNIYNLITGVPISGYSGREWGIFLLSGDIPNPCTRHL